MTTLFDAKFDFTYLVRSNQRGIIRRSRGRLLDLIGDLPALLSQGIFSLGSTMLVDQVFLHKGLH